jgi:hypothetical protein
MRTNNMAFSIKILVIFVFSLAGCSSSRKSQESGQATLSSDMSDGKYEGIVDHFTKKDEQYVGFGSAFQMVATIQNATVQEVQLLRRSDDFKWSRETYFKEKEKVSQEMSNESKVFLGFFSPTVENDRLETGKSIWKIYLVSEGARYEGVVQKESGALVQLQRLYPQYSRFYTPYFVKFKVPMAKVQMAESQFIITGPLGTSQVSFPAANSVTF